MKTYPWEKRHPHTFGQRTINDFILWIIVVVLALGFGIFVGHKVTAGYKDTEIKKLEDKLETAQASLAEANTELAFWQSTIRGLAEGNQLEGAEPNGRLSLGD